MRPSTTVLTRDRHFLVTHYGNAVASVTVDRIGDAEANGENGEKKSRAHFLFTLKSLIEFLPAIRRAQKTVYLTKKRATLVNWSDKAAMRRTRQRAMRQFSIMTRSPCRPPFTGRCPSFFCAFSQCLPLIRVRPAGDDGGSDHSGGDGDGGGCGESALVALTPRCATRANNAKTPLHANAIAVTTRDKPIKR